MLPATLVLLLGAYLLGSIPFGLLFTRLAGLGDIRRIGSGNIGATNVLRTGRKGLAAATLLLDGAKGFLAAILVGHVLPGSHPLLAWLGGLASVLGHVFPLWLGFKGGKGVATGIGALLGASFPVGLAAALLWLLMAAAFRISSLAALTAFALAPFFAALFDSGEAMAVVFAISALVFSRHAENIRRLLAGTEPRIGARK